MAKRRGKATIVLENTPSVSGFAAFVGKKEKEGPLGRFFYNHDDDTTFGCKTWEQAECELQKRAFTLAKASAGVEDGDIDLVFGGDLLNQCVATSHSLRQTSIPFVGLYGACSTMAESLATASIMVDGGYAERAAAITSSHFCSAERQFRFPLEYGGQRAPSSQWTATASGCAIVEPLLEGAPYVESVCYGAVADLGVCDINNMGSAMAPAAADTLVRYLRDTGTKPSDYGAVVTGDLGDIGSRILSRLCAMDGYDLPNHLDCGKMIFDRDTQEVGAGGSGCGCSAAVLNAYFLPMLKKREIKDILFMATGALMSTTTFQQKESIPSIAHLVHICAPM